MTKCTTYFQRRVFDRRQGRSAAVAAFAVAAVLGGATAAAAAVGFENPFHPSQCDIALRWSVERLASEPGSLLARRTHAEALLCRGLSGNDAAALDRARVALSALHAEEPGDLFILLYLAEAESRRFPLADTAREHFARAAALLPSADVGAARAPLARHIDARLASIARNRATQLPILAAQIERYERGLLAEAERSSLLSRLEQSGPAGLDRARRLRRQRPTGATASPR